MTRAQLPRQSRQPAQAATMAASPSPSEPQPAAQDTNKKSVLVFVDIPDIDNFMMVLSVCRHYDNHNVKIVLAPRPVDFEACWYGNESGKSSIKEQLPDSWTGFEKTRRIFLPYTKEPHWYNEIQDGRWRETYFKPDKPVSKLKKDTKEIYMEISAYRLTNFLTACKITKDRFKIYWDEQSLGPGKIQHGVRSSYHAPDWCYDFEQTERKKAVEYLTKATLQPHERRDKLIELCNNYITDQRQPHKHGSESKLLPFQQLMEDENKNPTIDPEIPAFVGGPFTDPLTWIDSGFIPKEVLAMASFIKGLGNLGPNSFNYAVDFNSPWMLFKERAKKFNITITQCPTECVKKIEAENLNYQIHRVMLNAVWHAGGDIAANTWKLACIVHEVLGTPPGGPYYDWSAVVMPRVSQKVKDGQLGAVKFLLKYVEAYLEYREWDRDGVLVRQEEIKSELSKDNEDIIDPVKGPNDARIAYIVMCFRVVNKVTNLLQYQPVVVDKDGKKVENGQELICRAIVNEMVIDVTCKV